MTSKDLKRPPPLLKKITALKIISIELALKVARICKENEIKFNTCKMACMEARGKFQLF